MVCESVPCYVSQLYGMWVNDMHTLMTTSSCLSECSSVLQRGRERGEERGQEKEGGKKEKVNEREREQEAYLALKQWRQLTPCYLV